VSLHHHPSETTLLAYASGQLREGLSLVVATHLAWCASCRDGVAAAEMAAGLLLADAPPADCSEDLLARTCVALDGRPVVAAKPHQPTSLPSSGLGLLLPHPLQGYVDRAGPARWRRLVPGVQQFPLIRRTTGGGTVRMLRIAPGMKMPRHGHAGIELAIVLDGSYRDEIGLFARGDLADLDQDIRHQPRADEREGCVCLIATERPLRFEGWLLRWIQPALGF
jgi:putative transcriptional regulator